jgi:hypothetical protein
VGTRSRGIVTLAIILMLNSLTPARANVFDDLWGMATDPLKLGHLSDNFRQTVLDALTQLGPLLGRADAIAQQRLLQIQEIVAFAIAGGAAVEAKANADMLALESKIMEDVDKEIFRVRCAAITTLNGTVQDAIVQALENLANSQPTLTILGIPIAQLHLKQVIIPSPDDAYFAAKAETLTELEKRVTESSSADDIFKTYARLENLAEATQCNFLDKPREIVFVREKSRLEVLQLPWTTVVMTDPNNAVPLPH